MATLEQDLEAEVQQIEQIVLRTTAAVVGELMDYLILRSPVVTGAYRASHGVLDGQGTILYEGPERPGSDEIITPGSRPILEPPSAIVAEATVIRQADPYERLELWNARFYAQSVEFHHSVYAQAAEKGYAYALELANQGGPKIEIRGPY